MNRRRGPTRAEIVRMRRRRRAPHSPTLAGRALPPVLSRRPVPAPPRPAAAKSGARRRFQTILTMPAAPLHTPALRLPRRRVSWRWFSFCLSLALGYALYLAWTSPAFRVSAATISGNQRLSPDEINTVLNLGGRAIFLLEPSELEARLRLNYPELLAARVNLSLPNRVTVTVVERKPLILWQQDGGYTWIDENGVAFRPRGEAQGLISVVALAAPAPGRPSEADPLSPRPYLSAELVKAIQTLGPNVPAGSTLVYDERYGLGWHDARGWQVFFGSEARDMALKWQVYQALADSLTQRGIYPALINVQYVNAPYYRMSR